MPPTPANGARLYTSINQTLEISITAQANIATWAQMKHIILDADPDVLLNFVWHMSVCWRISELLFSGPHNVNQTAPGPGQFLLRWTKMEKATPSVLLSKLFTSQSFAFKNESEQIQKRADKAETFDLMFFSSSTKYHSELRCVVVSVTNSTGSFLSVHVINVVAGFTDW